MRAITAQRVENGYLVLLALLSNSIRGAQTLLTPRYPGFGLRQLSNLEAVPHAHMLPMYRKAATRVVELHFGYLCVVDLILNTHI